MAKSFAPVAFLLLTLWSCNNKEVERLKVENDSLRAELLVRDEINVMLRDVNSLFDSIDVTRNTLRDDLGEGLPYENFTTRLRDIKSYVETTEDRISKVEKQLRNSKRNSDSYLKMLNALRAEFALRMEEVATLETDVAKYKEENAGLVNQVNQQKKEITEIKKNAAEEITKLDTKVKEISTAARASEADAFYTQAKTVEETANRTRLAPRKKKETLREALELYKKALSFGKTDAQADVTRLESKLK
jgi:chromosome segregation ATPase